MRPTLIQKEGRTITKNFLNIELSTFFWSLLLLMISSSPDDWEYYYLKNRELEIIWINCCQFVYFFGTLNYTCETFDSKKKLSKQIKAYVENLCSTTSVFFIKTWLNTCLNYSQIAIYL